VVIADGEVGSPVVGNPSVAVLLNQLSFDKYFGQVASGGICIVNSSLVDCTGASREDVELISIPMNEIANSLGDPRMVNMVAAGAYAAKSVAVSIETLKEALKDALPERNHRFIPANVKAIEAGAGRVA
jgi:2-oxoglutarate ferredoxin oxidoreductase subunit gamma